MEIKEALNRVKKVCFSHLYELEKESEELKTISKEGSEALEWEVHEVKEAIQLVAEYISNSIDDGR